MPWAVYYADGTRATDADTAVESVPTRGVIVVAESDPDTGRILLHGDDYYWYDDGWFGGDIFGLWDYLARPGMKRVLFGRSVVADQYEAVMAQAREDDYLPERTADHGVRE